jgi:thiol:disulfide interchange protein DsbD
MINITLAQPGDSWKSYVTWSFSVKYDSNCEATLNATAKLEKHWHIFSITHDPNKADFIGVPTTLTFFKNANYELIGGVKESKKPIEFKDEYGVQIYFDGEVTFSQRIKIKTDAAFDVKMEYEFQICDENGCLFPPAPDHTFKIKSNTDCGNVKSDDTATGTNVTESKVEEPESTESDTTHADGTSEAENEIGEYIPIDNSKEDSEKDVSLWIIFFAGFGAGLGAGLEDPLSGIIGPILAIIPPHLNIASCLGRYYLFCSLCYIPQTFCLGQQLGQHFFQSNL